MSSKPSQFRAQGHLSAANVIKHLEGIYGTTPVDVQPSRKVVQLIDVFMHCGEAGSTKQPGEDPRNGSTPLSKSQHPGSRRNGKYACTTCQKRKTKCEPRGDGVPCQSCQIQNVACSFVAHAEGVDVQRIAPRPETNRREVRREKYAPQACTSCRQRKSKCDGNQPVCGPCVQRGCEKQCTWGANGTANSACPSVVVHSLQQKNAALEKRIAMLEARIASPTEAASQVDLYEDNSSPVVFSTSRFGAGVKKQEPDDPDIEQLTAPMNHLHLRDDDLQLFGPTSILRLAPRKLEPLRTSREREMEESTYVLYGHTEIDWARHLPSDVCLSQYEHDKLLYLFFYCFSSWCLRVIPESFLRDMHCALRRPKDLPVPRTTHYSPMLHNAILALSTAFSDVPAVKAPGARKRFADKAMECLESEGERPSMSAVLALSILSNYHSSRGSPTLGYIYFGISARIAQSLGLGIDCTKWVEDGVISETDMQDRNWVFWATFCQDTCFSLYVGRDFGVHSVVDYGRIPIPFSDVNPGRWPWNDGPEQRPSYLGETFASACKLMVIAREIVDVVFVQLRSWPPYLS
ncbi:fungal-specific transcription factor domain-containing protein [Amylostereum chailletii]|nr:fungal-specific transcription factor domain-containing protein [Amylostereum chailletii]